MNSLELLLKQQVFKSRLLMNFINDFMELFEQLLLLLLKILELLKLDFVLPFDLFVLNFGDSDLVLSSLQFLFNVVTFVMWVK